MTAMLDQSDGNETTHAKTTASIFAHCGTRSLRQTTMRTAAHASDHMTLV